MAIPEFELSNNKPGIRVSVVQNAELVVMPAYRMKVRWAVPRPSAGRKVGSIQGY